MSILAGFMVPHPPMIVPAVGKGSEEQVKETTAAYEEVARQIKELEPDTIIITSPHAVMYADYFHISPGKKAEGSFSRFDAPQVSFSEKYADWPKRTGWMRERWEKEIPGSTTERWSLSGSSGMYIRKERS